MITQSEYNVTKQSGDINAKIYIMDFNYNILDEISGVVLSGSFNNDSKSALRRSCSVSISPTDSSFDISYGNKLWLDKYIKIYTGIRDVHTGEFTYTNRGIYLINNPSRVYNATDNTITIEGLDLMSKLTGERNGNLEGIPYVIPADTFSYNAIVNILNLGGFTQYALDYNNCPYVPNEIKIDVGGTLYDLLKAILDIDSMMQMYFDVDGVFHYERIPITDEEQIIIDDDIWSSVLIDYRQDTNYSNVKNSIEVLGKAHDITYYDGSATMSDTSGARTINVTLAGVTDYPSGLLFGVKFTSPTIPQRQVTYLEINGAPPLALNNNQVYEADDVYFEQNITYVFRITSGLFDDPIHPCIQYMGEIQPYAKVEETDQTSPFYIDGDMGIVREVLSGGDYDNISTVLMASERADWELYQRCRVQDNIILTCAPIYWADVNTLIEITLPNKNGIEETNRYMIKSISDSFGVSATQTITAMRYFPYYNTYEPNMEGIYDTVNLFVEVEEGTTESIALSANFDSYATIDWGNENEYPILITADTRYDRDYTYDELSEELTYTRNGINYKGVWIKIKSPRTEFNYVDLSYQTQNITKLYANVDTLQSINDVENLTEIRLIGNLTNHSLLNYSYLENVYMELKDTTNIYFQGTTSLKTVELDIPNVTSLTQAFLDCTSLESVKLKNTSSVEGMEGTFNNCSSLVDIEIDDTSNVTSMYLTFYECSSLKYIPIFDTSNVETMHSMFGHCDSLITIPLLNTINVTDMSGMFSVCSSLKSIPSINMLSVVDADHMCLFCTSLVSFNPTNTENILNAKWFFSHCTSLVDGNINTHSSTDITEMYYNCTSLESVTIDLFSITSTSNMASLFESTNSLKNITIKNANILTDFNIIINDSNKESIENLYASGLTKIISDNIISELTNLRTITLLDMDAITSTSGMFSNLSLLEEVNIPSMTSNLDASQMFYGCSSLSTITALDTSSVQDSGFMFTDCANLSEVPLIDTSNVVNMKYMFAGCRTLETIPLLDTSKVTNMNGIFRGCESLLTIPLLNTISLTDAGEMFYDCRNLTTMQLIDTSKVTSMSFMFTDCQSLTNIPELDTSNAIDMSNVFLGCANLTSVPLLNTSSATNMVNMFRSCSNLTTIPLLDTSNVTNMQDMFAFCSLLESIPLLNTSNVTNMAGLFYDCQNLTSIPLLNTSKVETMYLMLYNCDSLTTIPLFDTSNVIRMEETFKDCDNIETIEITDATNVNLTTDMLTNTNNLTTLILPNLYQADLTLPNINQMNATELDALFTSLGDCSLDPKTLTITGSLGASTCDTTIATNKGWIVVN